MAGFEPKRPTLAALGLHTFWIAILSLPMWGGKFLAGAYSDQYSTGYAFRHWIAETWKRLGHLPLWNPEIFGGLPLEAGHGDAFYPTALLRLVLPTDLAMNLGFVGHYLLAGLFTYLFLRALGVTWLGSVVGGLAYQLTGIVASLVSPGHDGKLFVSALLPLALLALVLAIRRRRFEGYGILALTVGLALLSPHYQMVYYLLLTAGIFALYLAFGERERLPTRDAVARLGLALAAVALGFGVAWIQVWPFVQYLPFSPRAQGYGGFGDSASYGIPWEHVPEFFLARFAGEMVGEGRTYWGSNYIKLHSEYLGLPVVGLAVLGVLGVRRRLVYWLGGVGLLLLLVALSDGTPFYRLWWEVMPFVKQTRAPGMAFFVPAFVVAAFAAFGVERLEAGEGRRHVLAWLGVGAGVALLAVAGAVPGLARSLASGIPALQDRPSPMETAEAAASVIRVGALLSGVALLATGAVAYGWLRGRLPVAAFAFGLIGLVGADLWRNAQPFWVWSDVERDVFRPDPITEYLTDRPDTARVLEPLRAFNLNVYPGAALMAHEIPELLGHHGNELHNFDQLMGGRNQWRHLFRPKLWDVMAVSHILVPTSALANDTLGGFRVVMRGVPTTPGTVATLFEREVPIPYARLVPTAIKVSDERAIPTVVDDRFPLDRVVLVPPDTPLDAPTEGQLAPPLGIGATVESWEPGAMRIALSAPAPADAYLVISENWYPAWHARVDGAGVPTVRGNVSLITVPVSAGARVVELRYANAAFALGQRVTFISLGLVLVALAASTVQRRRRSG